MGELLSKRFDEPDEIVSMPQLEGQIVVLGELYVGRFSHKPGWKWSTHVKPLVSTSSCQFHHQGVVLSGRLKIISDEGGQRTFEPGDVFDIAPGHDGEVIGDEPCETLEFRSVRDWHRAQTAAERVLATLLFTDIVDSTAQASRVGDTAWKALLTRHYDRIRLELDRFRGYEVKTTGDGVLALFDGPARAIRCAAAIHRGAGQDGLSVRAGVHTGEVERHTDTVEGVAVHVAARVAAKAGPGEVLVSASTVALLEGSGLTLVDTGQHELKGLEGLRQLYRLVDAVSTAEGTHL